MPLFCRARVQMEETKDNRVSPARSHGDAPRRVGSIGDSALLLKLLF